MTAFPGNLDNFIAFLDITATDGPLIAQYQSALQAGNTTQANQILSQISSGTQKILKASDLNKITQATLALERFFSSDIWNEIQNRQNQWQDVINQFSYKGVWASGTSYEVNNFVSYTVAGLTQLYIATNTPPVGTVPTNSTYWRVFTIQGQVGSSGVGLTFKQEWVNSTTYDIDDAVTYDGTLWMALQPSQNIEPGTNVSYWKQVVSFETISYPVQDTQPVGQDIGDLWFNTQGNPTQYYYLAPLTNPATASNIMQGYQAYDANGNLIVGTA